MIVSVDSTQDRDAREAVSAIANPGLQIFSKLSQFVFILNSGIERQIRPKDTI